MSEWYGALPERWESRKVNELFVERREKVSDTDFAPLSVSKGGTIPQIANVAKSNAGDNRKLVRRGDFAINSRSDRRGSSGVSELDGSVSLINIVLTSRAETNGRYWHYLLRSHNFIEEFYRNGRGIVADLWTTRYTEMKSIYLPLPPRDEQDQIVRYLDWKVSRVNSLINAKRRQIALLQEQKRAVINAAVTKSDEGWRETKIKREFVNLNYMRRPIEASERSQKGDVLYDYYGASGVVDKIDSYIFDQTTLLIAEDGANLVLRNLPLIYIATGKYWVNNHAHVLTPKNDNELYYMAYLLENVDYTKYITGAAQPKLSQENIGMVSIIVPPPETQRAIVAELDDKCGKIDSLVAALEREIALLHEYRTRLISDVVTGKLDVRGVAVPEYEAIEEVAEVGIMEDETEETENAD